MTDYGVTLTGFVKPTLATIQTDIRTAVLASAAFGADIDLDPDSPVGELIDIFAGREFSLWEKMEAVYNCHSPNNAEGLAQDDIAQIVNVTRLPARATVVYQTFIGTPGTPVPAGFQIAVRNTEDYFQTLSDFVIDPSGTSINITMESVVNGEIHCYANTLIDLMTSVPGVISATNLLDGIDGRLEETDSELNQRRLISLQAPGAATCGAIQAALQELDTVTEAVVFENDTDYTDIYGRPPHSVHCILTGGVDSEIAELIWSKKGAGIQTYGDVSYTVTDSQGYNHVVKWDISAIIPVYMHVKIAIDATKFNVGTTQIDTITVLSPATTVVEINGREFTRILAPGDTIITIAAALVSFINLNFPEWASVLATDNGDGTFLVEALFDGNPVNYGTLTNCSQVAYRENSGDALDIIDNIVDYCSDNQKISLPVQLWEYNIPVGLTSGLTSVNIYASLSTVVKPAGTSNISMSDPTQRAVLTASTVTVEIV